MERKEWKWSGGRGVLGLGGERESVDGQNQSQRSQRSEGVNEPLRANAVDFRPSVRRAKRKR